MNVAIVTGASRGIGRATAVRLGEHFFVVVNYLRNEYAAMQTVAEIENRGGKAMIVQGDVSKYEDAKKVVEEAVEHGSLKILVNNAGIYQVKDFSAMMPSEWERIFQVNVYGTMNMTHAAIEHMEDGVIVNVASIIGLHPMSGAAAYCASKAAVVAFTKAVAGELFSRIRVVCVAPGPTRTDMLKEYHNTMFADPPEKVADYIMHAIDSAAPGECVEVR
ncbi:MAG: SDR family NAD(P)-dependent oxidoreductase [Euryarchaeota archaeon]|nr:SDR family NAD(P)-dependent oxidoreductase [Euryarchaeota archaeon]